MGTNFDVNKFLDKYYFSRVYEGLKRYDNHLSCTDKGCTSDCQNCNKCENVIEK